MKKQESVYQSLRELVNKGKELEITCEEFLEKAKEFYQEGGNKGI